MRPGESSSIVRFVTAVMLCAVLAAGGCGGHAKVENEKRSADAPSSPPSMIYVRNFDLGAAKVKKDPGTISGRPALVKLGPSDAEKELIKLGDELEQSIVENLRKAKLPAQRLADDAPRPTSGWIVWGDFLEMTEGNRLERAIVGFGAGSANDKLYVSVADATQPEGKDLIDFNVTSQGSKRPGAAPGAVALHTPIGMAAAFVLGGDEGEKNLQAAAKEISAEIVKLAGQK
jgi:hypothetical protein